MRTTKTYDISGNVDITGDRMREACGDVLRIADVNYPVPGLQEVGLFAVPYRVETTADQGSIKFALCDGSGKIQATSPTLGALVLWVVRTYNDKASLTDMALGLI